MPNKEYDLPDEEIQALLKSVIDVFDQEDRSVRDRQIRLWRRLKLYWDGFQRTWWSEIAHDWRIYDDQQQDLDNHNDYYDKPVNVFRAYLESIIAALSIVIPPVKCIPDSIDNPLDVSTAKAGTKIAALIYKHVNASLLWLHALFVFVTEGLVFAYNYTKTDEKYGTYKKENWTKVKEEHHTCPECGDIVDEQLTEVVMDGEDRNCLNCGNVLPPELTPTTIEIPKRLNDTDEPKSRQCIEVYGGLYVKVPNYAINQEQMPYLFYSYETHFSNVIEEFKHLRKVKDWVKNVGYDSGGMYDPYERWGRLNPTYHGEYPVGTVTLRQCWLRPSAFNVLPEESADKLQKLYPEGVKVTLANDEFADAYGECLDAHWTLTKNPMSDYLHHDPLGLLLTSIQDITNELVSLVIQTIEHGIPQTFADPSVLNFNQYRQTEVAPGSIFPARPATGKSIGDAFYEIKTATLSGEVLPFGQKIQELGQLVVGALPSLFGGAMPGGGQTASEYSMSRAQALQRLQVTWKMFTVWWKEIFAKVIPAYMENVQDNEQFTEKDDVGNYVSVVIRKADLQGKIGSVELEANENLPMSHNQVKDAVMSLMELQNPVVMEALLSPENLPFVKEAVGLDNFKIPGAADRQKQYEEISMLLQSEPILVPQQVPGAVDPMTGVPVGPPQEIEIEIPSVEIEPEVDDHEVQAQLCRNWLVSEAGQLAKQENPQGYKNVLLHMQMHIQVVNEQMAAAQPPPDAQGSGSPPKPVGASQEGIPNAPGLPQ